ncbi:MAG: F0F1 ATP synthase subunit delta [Candidatus Sulfobium sp.]|jgi:F-type H+-transporting ATPase subunit b
MRFDLTTFLFQIINFIVLLFILKRLLYKPVREIIEKRRAMIEKTVQDAEKTKKEALDLREKYLKETAGLKDLRQQTIEKLREEAMEERKRLLGTAEEEAGKVVEKEKAIFGAEKRRLEAELKDRAIDTACVMAAHLLRDVSTEELHKAVCRKLLGRLEEVAQNLADTVPEKDEAIRIELASAYPLNGEELKELTGNLESLLSKKVIISTVVDENLIAGARMKAYDKVYNFSLSGQVDLFRSRLEQAS